jgi:hypothetical protein
MKTQLDQIESRLQSLIESSITILLPWGNPQHMLAHQVVESMRNNSVTTPDGQVIAPNQYVILVHPSRITYWQSNQPFLDEVARVLYQAGMDAGMHFIKPPTFHLATKEELLPNGIVIAASIGEEHLAQTSALESSLPGSEEITEHIPSNAFLIVNGVDVYQLRQSVINVGRRPDNHLVIDDPRVSRTHAQLRASKGHFILFDLNSTGGTYVNSQRISQCRLNPGDVISLAGVPLIYGQDSPPGLEDTDVYPVGNGTQPE